MKIQLLSGGITNKNFRIDADGCSYVLRLSDRSSRLLGIDRDREYACAKAAAKAGVGARVLEFVKKDGILVTEFIRGRPVSKTEVRRPRTLERVAASLKRIHGGPAFPGKFLPFDTIRRYYKMAKTRGVHFPASMRDSLAFAWRMESWPGSARRVPCHNDLLLGNFIDDGKRIRIIDWEYAAMGDPFFDLGNFAANSGFSRKEDELLLKLYFGEIRSHDFVRLQRMKAVSDLRESLWGFLQAGISSISFDFLGYGAKHLARFKRRCSSLSL